MSNEVEIEGSFLKIDLYAAFRSMSESDKKDFINQFSLQEDVIQMVTNYICGADEFGRWTSSEPELRQKILERIEKSHITKLSEQLSYGWNVWREIQQALKSIQCKKQVYWALNHDGQLSEYAHDFFMRHKIESNYTTKEADADIERIELLIKNALKDMIK